MSITVKDIHEKVFGKQSRGYNVDEVDDFLDAIAETMEALVRENMALRDKADQSPAAVESAPVPKDYKMDEPSYLKNLEATLRETLISAQRIADETVADARVKADQLIAGAEDQANALVASAKNEAEAARGELQDIKKATVDYRERFLRLVKDQAHVLKAETELFGDA